MKHDTRRRSKYHTFGGFNSTRGGRLSFSSLSFSLLGKTRICLALIVWWTSFKIAATISLSKSISNVSIKVCMIFYEEYDMFAFFTYSFSNAIFVPFKSLADISSVVLLLNRLFMNKTFLIGAILAKWTIMSRSSTFLQSVRKTKYFVMKKFSFSYFLNVKNKIILVLQNLLQE